MSSSSLPAYKARCDSAEEAQHLADNAARVAACLQVGADHSTLVHEQMMVARHHQDAYLGQLALLEQIAGLRARVAELDQQLRAARQTQPATASGNGRGGHGGPAYGGIQKHHRRGQGRSKKYQGKPPGPRRDDGAAGAGSGASGVGA
ncbi:hypothetical protein KCU91_g8014, partial [Aureobasidium melanogenum]